MFASKTLPARLRFLCNTLAALPLLSVVPTGARAAEEPAHAPALAAVPYALPETAERFMTSKAGREYRIMVSWPKGKPPAGGYPVCYVLDGDDYFAPLTGILRIQSGTEKASKHNGIRGGLIVAIGYRAESKRDLDYTPAAPPAPPETYRDGRPYPKAESGGADAFFEFLQHELRPLIEKEYPVNRQRQTLLGAGYGGLFTLHVLFTKPQTFDTYVAASPSIWWNGRYVLEEEKAFAANLAKAPVPARLFLSVGDLEQSLTQQEYSFSEGPREEHGLKVTRRRMVDNTREMYWRLQKLAPQGLAVQFHLFAEESHKSVVPMAITRALPFIFPPQAGAE